MPSLGEVAFTAADIPDAPCVLGLIPCDNERETEHFLPLVGGKRRRNQVKQQAALRCDTIVSLQVTCSDCEFVVRLIKPAETLQPQGVGIAREVDFKRLLIH